MRTIVSVAISIVMACNHRGQGEQGKEMCDFLMTLTLTAPQLVFNPLVWNKVMRAGSRKGRGKRPASLQRQGG